MISSLEIVLPLLENVEFNAALAASASACFLCAGQYVFTRGADADVGVFV